MHLCIIHEIIRAGSEFQPSDLNFDMLEIDPDYFAHTRGKQGLRVGPTNETKI